MWMWQTIQDRLFGFLPERSALTMAVIYFVVCFVSLKISEKLTHAYSLPWQKQENQRVREKIRKEESE
ncbi:hypothetical protein CR205_09745 [Alteribacter lacisalsi]|uniref:Uncharacterized protein n=1 Tax=Alteribacter lacisalsi TaxID=2045244 RepID=A0A2W0HD89_9BACI|nr:hypothetical protein CR205_09745 [Alteribacter lacisalsi]